MFKRISDEEIGEIVGSAKEWYELPNLAAQAQLKEDLKQHDQLIRELFLWAEREGSTAYVFDGQIIAYDTPHDTTLLLDLGDWLANKDKYLKEGT